VKGAQEYTPKARRTIQARGQ